MAFALPSLFDCIFWGIQMALQKEENEGFNSRRRKHLFPSPNAHRHIPEPQHTSSRSGARRRTTNPYGQEAQAVPRAQNEQCATFSSPLQSGQQVTRLSSSAVQLWNMVNPIQSSLYICMLVGTEIFQPEVL